MQASAGSDWLVETLRRVTSDLENPVLDLDTMDAVRVSLERVYRELEVRIATFSVTARNVHEAAEYVRNALSIITSFTDELGQPNCVPELLLPDGGFGRPRYNVAYDQLVYLLENRFTVPQISAMLGISVRTVRRRMEHGLSVHQMYTDITETELCRHISSIQQLHPNFGNRQMFGALVSQGIWVTQERVRECQRRIDPEGSALRRLQVVHRRNYCVSHPLSLWHMDMASNAIV